MLFAVIAALGLGIIIMIGLIPESGFLREINTGEILNSSFMKGIVAFIFIGSWVMVIAYGIGAKTFKNDSDVMNGMGKSFESLGVYKVLVFFAAQFVTYFNWTNIGLIIA